VRKFFPKNRWLMISPQKTNSLFKPINQNRKEFLTVDRPNSEIVILPKHDRTGRPPGAEVLMQQPELLPKLSVFNFEKNAF
jgi:hypothetical protein